MSMSTQPENPVSTQKPAERLVTAAQKIEMLALALQDDLLELAKELRVQSTEPAPTTAVAPPIEAREYAERIFNYAMDAVQEHLTIFPHAEWHPLEMGKIENELRAYYAACRSKEK